MNYDIYTCMVSELKCLTRWRDDERSLPISRLPHWLTARPLCWPTTTLDRPGPGHGLAQIATPQAAAKATTKPAHQSRWTQAVNYDPWSADRLSARHGYWIIMQKHVETAERRSLLTKLLLSNYHTRQYIQEHTYIPKNSIRSLIKIRWCWTLDHAYYMSARSGDPTYH